MTFSQFALKLAVGACVAWAVPVGAFGQTAYSPQGGEYSISGALPGDQVKPRLSVNAGGGYAVWQDNNTDGDGWGISARALDSNLAGVGSPFRVNILGKYDQENPQVALLNNGGAVFVWQGGRQGFQHVYARFLSPTNTWLTSDVMVNSSTNTHQINPAVAVLTNGNVVVVYATYNANTMQDVYGQILSPTGQKVGAEFQLNQFTPYNQRTPAVAALTNGGFVAAWVSEQQQAIGTGSAGLVPVSQLSRPSVDIYARLFNSAGAPTVGEFWVNQSSNVCANPNVAVAADGNLMMAWGGRDLQVLNNGWDIYSRPFNLASGTPVAGTVARVNTQLYGDQYAPQIRALGTTYLVVWTSMGQDGDREGVYGQFLGGDGTPSGGEFRVNTTTLSRQKEPALAADNYGRFLVVWTSFVGLQSGFDLFGQIYAAAGLGATSYAANYGTPVFVPGDLILSYPDQTVLTSGGSGGTDSTLNSTNAYLLASRTYNGLFSDTNGVTPLTSGYFTLTTTRSGTNFSGKLSLGGGSLPFTSKFDQNGRATFSVGQGAAAVNVSLQLDMDTQSQISGLVSRSGVWGAVLYASYNSGAAPSVYSGTYGLTIPPTSGGISGPIAGGSGTAVADVSGKVTWGLTLPDGTKLSQQTTTASPTGAWPLYAPLYGGRGVVMSWMQFTTNPPAASVNGQLVWIKPPGAAKPYSAGVTNEVSVTGLKTGN